VLRWTDPSWLAEVHDWIHVQIERHGAAVLGSIDQPHVRPWSTLLRVPSSDGTLWFKASMPELAHEPAIVSILARRRPDCVPALLAVELEKGWMLMRDGGERLRETIERERDLRRWLAALPQYAELQIDLVVDADELVTRGAPDRRLAILAAQYEQLLDEMDGRLAGGGDLRRLRALGPRVSELCGQLAEYGVPQTIQHDDFHDGQILVRDGRYVFFDWGDACVSHPFFTMAVTLEGVIAWGLDDVEGSEDITPYRDAYLRPFERFASRAELEAVFPTALRLGWICRALNVHRFASALEPPHREEHLSGVATRLRLFSAGLV
jgi:hypothetical protein